MGMKGSVAHPVHVLVIEDDPVYQRTVVGLLSGTPEGGFEVTTAATVSEGLPLLATRPIDLVLLDLNLPDTAGFEGLDRVQRSQPNLPVVILTGTQPDHAAAVRAVAMGAQDYLLKSRLDRDMLVRTIRYALERKHVLVTLESSLIQLEQANRDLREFASVLGHDLKAPIRGIGLIIDDLLAAAETTGASRDALSRIRDRLDLMKRLIDGVRDYTSAGQDATTSQDVEAGEVVRHALQLVAPPSSFTVQVAPDLPRLRTNATQLEQVFQNLIGNAVRHHGRPQGRIRVGWEGRGEILAFYVEDDGPGLPVGMLERVFQPRKSLAALRPESGLGLAIVEKLVHLNGGEITVRSDPKNGSRFEFTWPRAPPRTPQAPLV